MCRIRRYLAHLFLERGTNNYGKKISGIFSASGTTKKVAEMIADSAKADLFEITPEVTIYKC